MATHLLILISEAQAPLSSTQMAESVGTNPSFVRKILGALKHDGLLESHQGKAGFTLTRPPCDVTMLQIYQAVYGETDLSIFELHKNPNDRCVVGRYIKPTLANVFDRAQREAQRAMASTTLADCIADMRTMISKENTR